MSEHHWLRRRWKLVLNVVTLIALVLLVIAIWDQLADTLKNLENANAWYLLLLLPIEALNYHAQTKMFQHLFHIVGNKLSYKYLYRVALELNFVNNVFPSGGVTGISYFSLRMRTGNKLTGAKATLVNAMKLALTFISFEILIFVALFSLAIMGRVNDVIILVAGSLSTLLFVGTFGFAYMVESNSRINSFFTFLTSVLNRLIRVVRRKHPETISIDWARKAVGDFHDNYKAIRANIKNLGKPFWYALLANATEVMVIYVVFMAFGHFVNVGAVILAYAIANFAGAVSVLPGGVGIYEALMVGTLASIGVPASTSLPVIVTYRVLNTAIQVPPGYYFYQKAINENKQAHVA